MVAATMTDSAKIVMPKTKTRLAPALQLERTLELALSSADTLHRQYLSDQEEYGVLNLGMMIKSTRLCNMGDFLVFCFDNGQAERWKCTAVSSKGYRIIDMYIHFQAWRNESFRWGNGRYYVRHSVPGRHKLESPRRDADAVIVKEKSGQPLKLLSVIRDWSADPASQARVLERLRTGAAVSR